MRKKRSDTNWKSPTYWEEVTALVRVLADRLVRVARRYLAPAANRATVGQGPFVYVPVYPSLREIATFLNERGFRTRQGKKFGPETVRLLLERTTPNPEPIPEEFRPHNSEVASWLDENALILNHDVLTARVNGKKAAYREGQYDLNPKDKVGRTYSDKPKPEESWEKWKQRKQREQDESDSPPPIPMRQPIQNPKEWERIKRLRLLQAEQEEFYRRKQAETEV
jgi:hypothetical protein